MSVLSSFCTFFVATACSPHTHCLCTGVSIQTVEQAHCLNCLMNTVGVWVYGFVSHGMFHVPHCFTRTVTTATRGMSNAYHCWPCPLATSCTLAVRGAGSGERCGQELLCLDPRWWRPHCHQLQHLRQPHVRLLHQGGLHCTAAPARHPCMPCHPRHTVHSDAPFECTFTHWCTVDHCSSSSCISMHITDHVALNCATLHGILSKHCCRRCLTSTRLLTS